EVKETRLAPYSVVFGDDTFVLHRHVPTDKWHHPRPEFNVTLGHRRRFQIFTQLISLPFNIRRRSLSTLFESQLVHIVERLHRIFTAHAGVAEFIIALTDRIDQSIKSKILQ